MSIKDFLKHDHVKNKLDEYQIEDTDGDSDVDSKGFPWSRSPLDSEKSSKLTTLFASPSFSSVSAKKIQKEQLWLNKANKRPNTSPNDESHRRSKSICQ